MVPVVVVGGWNSVEKGFQVWLVQVALDVVSTLGSISSRYMVSMVGISGGCPLWHSVLTCDISLVRVVSRLLFPLR